MQAATSAQPQLTIVVPSYNVAQYLPKALDSYADQRLAGLLEVIVIDDGSHDETAQIAADYADRYSDIFRLVRKENGGHGSAVNAGIACAQGRYLRVIDADDWATTDELVRFCELLSTLTCDLVMDIKTEVDMRSGRTQRFDFPSFVPQGQCVSVDELCTHDTLAAYLMIHTLTIRTAYLHDIGLKLLEHAFYVDYEFVVKATLDAQDVYFADTCVYNYLVGNAQQSVADANYVRRWSDHTRVTWEICELTITRSDLSVARLSYLMQRARRIVNTHYNIALIFDADRKRGARRAREFRRELKARCPKLAVLCDRRYALSCILHYLGVRSQDQLNKLLHRRWRSKY